jgi:ABC-type branched-subunit amino acid transport system ATPase component
VSGLEVQELRVAFGGLVAVDQLSFVAPHGQITGLIGPNGAGKSTTFNACFGTVASTGSVRLDGRDISRSGTAARARLGLGRTFQRVQLYDSLSVHDNVLVGFEGALAGRNPLRHLWAPASQRRAGHEAVHTALERCGIADRATQRAGALSLGQRRLVELARALAGEHSMLLLDEPASGLDGAQTATFGQLLRSLCDDGHLGVLLVEHDIEMVSSVCDRVYVLDFGMLIYQGTVEEAMGSDIVRAAYLGSPAVTS